MNELILARHASSEITELGVVNGDAAVPDQLSATGVAQALSRLAPVLETRPPDVVVTSRFARTAETAAVALASVAVPSEIDPGLDDLHFGVMEGRPLTEYRSWYAAHGPDGRIGGSAESRRQTVVRWVRAFSRISSRPEDRVLVVTHGLAVTYLLRSANGDDLDGFVQPAAHAEPHILDSDTVTNALARLSDWSVAQEAVS